MATQATAPFFGNVAFAQVPQRAAVTNSREALALSDAQKLAIELMIAATILDQQGVSIAAVDESIKRKYMYIKTNSIDLSLTGVATSFAGATTYWSSQKVESVSELVTAMLRASAEVLKYSSNASEKVFNSLGITWLLERSVDSSTWAYNNLGIKHVLEWSSRKGIREFMAAGTALSSAGISIMYLTNDTNEAVSYATIRNMLGQDEQMRRRVDSTVETLSSIFNLQASGKDKLKLALYDEVLKQAIKNKFSEDASKYNIDLIDLMLKNQLIDRETADAVLKIRQIAKEITPSTNVVEMKAATLEAVDMSLALAAMLEQQIHSQKVKDAKTLKHLQTLLGSITAKLTLIGFNLKK